MLGARFLACRSLTYRLCLAEAGSPTFKFCSAFIEEGSYPLLEIACAATGALQARFQLKLVFLGIGKALANCRFYMAIGLRGTCGQMRGSGLPLGCKFFIGTDSQIIPISLACWAEILSAKSAAPMALANPICRGKR